MVSDRLFKRYYGNPKFNGTLSFYSWVRKHVTPTTRLLNIGAGPPTHDPLRILKGEVAEVIGADIDPIVLDNPELDGACLIEDGRLPLEDQRFDIVLSDYTLEHVEKPREFLGEVRRVMKPGGSFFFRTPNLYHYVSAFSAVTPDWVHKAVANKARALPKGTHDPWPTHYRMNSRSALRRLARDAGFSSVELRTIECEPSYLMFNAVPFMAGVAYERLVNSTELLAGLRVNILGRLVR